MYFDSNVVWDAKRAPALAESALRFGFSGIAHNVTLGPAQFADIRSHKCVVDPPNVSLSAQQTCGPLRSLAKDLGIQCCSSRFLQVKRATLKITDAAHVVVVGQLARLKAAYDLIAVRPLTDEAFQHTCHECECDIISLNLDEKLPFPVRRKDVLAFLKRGGYFEVEFAPALRDVTKRRHVIANTEQLLHATRGKNVLLSSGAADPMELRSPHDLANFASVLGLRGALARQSVGEIPIQALQRAVLRHGLAQNVPPNPAPTIEEDEDMAI